MSLGVIVLGRVLTLGQDVTATKGLELFCSSIHLILISVKIKNPTRKQDLIMI